MDKSIIIKHLLSIQIIFTTKNDIVNNEGHFNDTLMIHNTRKFVNFDVSIPKIMDFIDYFTSNK